MTLEEMDILFGSEGTAEADKERMKEVNRQVGLDDLVHGHPVDAAATENEEVLDEKREVSAG